MNIKVIKVVDNVVKIITAGPQGPQGIQGPVGPSGGGFTGQVEIDFGSTPSDEANVVITGQAGITQNAIIQVSLPAMATSNNTANDAEFAAIAIDLSVGNIVDNVGFTIKAFCTIGFVTGKFKINYRW